LPAIFALDGAQEALEVAERPTSGFRPSKARSNPSMQAAKGLLSVHDVSEGRCGSQRYGKLVLLHDLLLSLVVSVVAIHAYRVSQVKREMTKLFYGF
jgi:hypothetical protein